MESAVPYTWAVTYQQMEVRAAFHEAGHAVAVKSLGFSVEFIGIWPEGLGVWSGNCKAVEDLSDDNLAILAASGLVGDLCSQDVSPRNPACMAWPELPQYLPDSLQFIQAIEGVQFPNPSQWNDATRFRAISAWASAFDLVSNLYVAPNVRAVECLARRLLEATPQQQSRRIDQPDVDAALHGMQILRYPQT